MHQFGGPEPDNYPMHERIARELRTPDGTVNDIADNELLSRAVRNCRRGRGRAKLPLWSVVADRFALGSTYAGQLCRRFGLDPDEMVKTNARIR